MYRYMAEYGLRAVVRNQFCVLHLYCDLIGAVAIGVQLFHIDLRISVTDKVFSASTSSDLISTNYKVTKAPCPKSAD
jgi:hypothetical protein